MSERKVLNKYYPPDFDPAKIPRLHLPKDRQYTVRLMAPCNMRCTTCGEYIYKGKKFNSRKETVQGEEYLGLKIFRFYIKCTRCLAEITFKTDPENMDYIVEHGATRNFQALKLAEEQAEREEKEEEEDLKSNPMKLLEKRTQQSKYEMEMLEALEDLRDLNKRQSSIDFESILRRQREAEEQEQKQQEEEDERFIQSIFGRDQDNRVVKRIMDEDSSDSEDEKQRITKKPFVLVDRKASEMLVEGEPTETKPKAWDRSVGDLKSNKLPMIRVKPKSETLKPFTETKPAASGLGLLTAYSDSDDSEL